MDVLVELGWSETSNIGPGIASVRAAVDTAYFDRGPHLGGIIGVDHDVRRARNADWALLRDARDELMKGPATIGRTMYAGPGTDEDSVDVVGIIRE